MLLSAVYEAFMALKISTPIPRLPDSRSAGPAPSRPARAER